MGQIAEISLVQNDPPLIFKQSLLIIGQKHYLKQTRGEGGENEKIQITVVQHPEISIFCGCNRFFFNSEGGVFKKYANLAPPPTTFKFLGPPPTPKPFFF